MVLHSLLLEDIMVMQFSLNPIQIRFMTLFPCFDITLERSYFSLLVDEMVNVVFLKLLANFQLIIKVVLFIFFFELLQSEDHSLGDAVLHRGNAFLKVLLGSLGHLFLLLLVLFYHFLQFCIFFGSSSFACLA